MPSATDALIWWNNPSRKAVLHGTTNPAYGVGSGFTGDGVNKYIDTTFNSSVDGGTKYTQNDNSNGHWFMNERVAALTGSGLLVGINGIGSMPNYGGQLRSRAQGPAFNTDNTRIRALFTNIRKSATLVNGYIDKVALGSDVTNNSVALQNASVYNLAFNADGSPAYFQSDTIGLAFYGAQLDATDIKVLIDACANLSQALLTSTYISCDGTVIDTNIFTVTNPNPTDIAFTQNDGILMDELGTTTHTFLANSIKTVSSQVYGQWEFDALCIGNLPYSFNRYTAFGLWRDINNFVVIYWSNVDPWTDWLLKIRIAGTDTYIVTTGVAGSGKFRIRITIFNEILVYRFINDAWVQIGTTQKSIDAVNNSLGALNFGLSTTGDNKALTVVRDIKINMP
jgi:hypothetical protein